MAAVMVMPQAFGAKKDENPELKVMSYNVRNGSSVDGTNSWNLRYIATYEMLKDQAPDVFGIQEALDHQVAYIKDICRYEAVGVGREDGKKKGEQTAIFWNKKTVSMVKWGTFWLSETPEKPSKGWDAESNRTATWALMKDKRTGDRFYVVNTHLDEKGTEARAKGLQLIVDRIAGINKEGYPVVFTGDFGMTPDDKALSCVDNVMKSARKIAQTTDNKGTFNNWGKADKTVDYIYISGFGSCPEYQTVTKKYSDWKFISDHYPVAAKLIF